MDGVSAMARAVDAAVDRATIDGALADAICPLKAADA
jgi:hypothetical protein